MSAPLSPTTTYSPSSTPSIKAQDLNDLQQYLYSGLYSGLFSIKALTIDSTGGVSVTLSANSPLTTWKDTAGNVRGIIDHNGYRTGRTYEFRENWSYGLF